MGKLRLARLNAIHVEKFYSDMTEAGTPAPSQHKAGVTLGVALRHAVHPLRLIPHNPAADVPKPKVVKKEMQVFDAEQCRRFLFAAKGDRFHALYSVWIASGTREGELLALTWADVDFAGRAIGITKSLEELGGRLRIKDTKTAKSRRRVALPDFAISALKDHRKAMLAEGNHGTASPVFCDTHGGHVRKSNLLRRSFRPVIVAANAKEAGDAKREGRKPKPLPRIRPVDLRHSAATLLMVAGEPVKVVSERLGHSTAILTPEHIPTRHAGSARESGGHDARVARLRDRAPRKRFRCPIRGMKMAATRYGCGPCVQ